MQLPSSAIRRQPPYHAPGASGRASEKWFAGNLKLVAVDNASLHAEFLSKVLQSDERKYAARWTRKSVRDGLAAPAVKGSDAEVIAFVRATPGAVGYVSNNAAGVKVLEKF